MHKFSLRKSRLFLSLLFFCIAIPSFLLLKRSYVHIQSEEDLNRREASNLIAEQLSRNFYEDLALEDRRSFTEYRYLVVAKQGSKEDLTPSPLSYLPPQSNYKGLIGFFQIESDGTLRTPTLPEGRLSALQLPDRAYREILKLRLEKMLEDRSIFQYGSVQRISWNDPEQSDPQNPPHLSRREQGTEKQGLVFDVENLRQGNYQVDLPFDVEVHPFHAQLKDGKIIFHRNVFRLGRRLIQGYVVEANSYLEDLLAKLSLQRNNSDLNLSIQDQYGQVIAQYGHTEGTTPVFKTQINGPIANLYLSLYAPQNSHPKGAESLILLGIILILVAGTGLLAVERMLYINHQSSQKQADFISAVSHELKTPITAIMMNCEMLEQGMVQGESKLKSCYRRITAESQRLSRLIHNILDLTQLERNHWRIRLEQISLDEIILDTVKLLEPNVNAQGFSVELNLNAARGVYSLDRDAMRQIMTNLIDNALKFCADAESKKIKISTIATPGGTSLVIRDFGPGVPTHEIRKIFETFYRVEREMVRKTSGTGIGLSLVRHFCELMQVHFSARNCQPGLEIQLFFKDSDSEI